MLIIVENFAQPSERIFSPVSQPKLNVAGFIRSTTPEYIFQQVGKLAAHACTAQLPSEHSAVIKTTAVI